MTENESVNERPVDDNTASTEEKKPDDQPTKTPVHNPFEAGSKELTPEELESLEQFKEAQTERD